MALRNAVLPPMKDLNKIRRFVGDITAKQLTYVDCAVTDNIGIFMPVAS